jgi:hypothetical protein
VVTGVLGGSSSGCCAMTILMLLHLCNFFPYEPIPKKERKKVVQRGWKMQHEKLKKEENSGER